MSFSVKLHGVRGSRPKHKPDLLGFGGHSTSIEFCVDDDFYLFLDGGSGLVKRGQELGERPANSQFHFLITHTHWDHLLGLPFFAPFYGNNQVTFHAPTTTKSSFARLFEGLMNPDRVPAPLADMKADFKFKQIQAGEQFAINGKLRVKTFQLNHQGITLGYRVEYKGAAAIVITDNAPIDNGNFMGEGMKDKAKSHPAFGEKFNEGLIKFLHKADLVIFDTHFTEANLKPDWGHSTPPRALEFCKKAQVKRLVLFHHAPEDNDESVRKKVESVAEDAKAAGIEVCAAQEEKEWHLVA